MQNFYNSHWLCMLRPQIHKDYIKLLLVFAKEAKRGKLWTDKHLTHNFTKNVAPFLLITK
jgi:hypothetical protein